MDSIATLGLRVQSLEVEVAEKRLRNLTTTSSKAEKAAIDLTKYWRQAVVVAGLLGTAIYKILEKTSEFQVLQANLITATGSIDGASRAFTELKRLAAETPFSLQEVTTAFTKLVNYGLTPSERALRSYGNFAAANSKDIVQFIEAVADASVGEFTRMKESFGIVGKNLGDTVTFRFRGVTTEVKNNAKEIEEYFMKLGETKFAGGMERQMSTLKGATANLGDAWDVLLAAIGESGPGDTAEAWIRSTSEALNELTALAESGKLAAGFNVIGAAIESQKAQTEELLETIYTVLKDGTILIGTFVAQAEPDSEEWGTYWEDVFTQFPNNVAYMIKLAQIELDAFLKKSEVVAEKAEGFFSQMGKDLATSAVANWQWFLGNGTVQGNKDAINRGLTQKEVDDTGYSPLGGGMPPIDLPPDIDKETEERIDSLNRETDALKKNAAEHVDRAKELTDTYNGMVLPSKPGADPDLDPMTGEPYGEIPGLPPLNGGDVLGSFYAGGDNTTLNSSGKKPPKARVVNEKSAAVLEAEYQAQLLDSIYDGDTNNALEALDAQEAQIRVSYMKRKAEILAMTELTETQKLELMRNLETQYSKAQEDFQRKRYQAQLSLAADFFGNISTIAQAGGQKGHKIAQAAAIAQTTIKTYESATSAYASLVGIPYVGPVLATTAAAAAIASGLMNIQKIKSTEYTGAYELGGIVPGGSFSGDQLTASVNSGEMILNRNQQRELFAMANGRKGSTGGSGPRIEVYNLPGQDSEIEISDDGDRISIKTVDATMKELRKQARQGGDGPFKDFANVHNLRRK